MSKRQAATTKRACPRCGAQSVAPIMYGMPSPQGFAKVERGEVVLGGCIVSPDAPRWACQSCHARFGKFATDEQDDQDDEDDQDDQDDQDGVSGDGDG